MLPFFFNMKKLLILIVNILSLPIFAQDIYFNKRVDTGFRETCYSIILHENGFVVSAGLRETGNYVKLGCTFITNEGDLKKNKIYSAYGNLLPGFSNGLINAKDGGFLLATTIQRPSEDFSKDYLMRFNYQGDTLWTKTIGDTNFYFAGTQVKELEDENLIYLALATDASDSYHRIYLAKLDKVGKKIWHKTFGTGPYHFKAYSIDVCKDGGFIIGGQRQIGRYDYPYVMKVDSLGNFQWEKDLGDTYPCNYTHCFNGIANVLQLSNGDIFAVADVVKYKISGNDFYQSRFVCFSPNGTIKWDKWYGQVHIHNYMGFPIELRDGTIVTGGQDITPRNRAVGALFNLSASGDSLWWRNYSHPQDSTASNYMRSLKQTPDGGIIAAGFVNGPQDIWVLKLDSMGCEEPLCHTVGIKNIQIPELDIKAFPNPSTGVINFEYSLQNQAQLYIYNSLGSLVRQEELTEDGRIIIDLSSSSGSLYFYHVEVEGKLVKKGKLVVVR
jgi:hypothetical protein